MAKSPGEQLTKRMLSDDFNFCMGHLAVGDNGDEELDAKSTLRDMILETGLKKYKDGLGKDIDKAAEQLAYEVFSRTALT